MEASTTAAEIRTEDLNMSERAESDRGDGPDDDSISVSLSVTSVLVVPPSEVGDGRDRREEGAALEEPEGGESGSPRGSDNSSDPQADVCLRRIEQEGACVGGPRDLWRGTRGSYQAHWKPSK